MAKGPCKFRRDTAISSGRASSVLFLLISFLPLINSQSKWYCGTEFVDANTSCSNPCPSGAGCPVGQACWETDNCGSNTNAQGYTQVTTMTATYVNSISNDASSSSVLTTTGIAAVEETLQLLRDTIDDKLFLYETPLNEWLPSSVYRFDGFFEGLRVMHQVGVAGKKIYMGVEYDENGNDITGVKCKHCHMYGLINIAAFLAQAMKETIRYDACDENSWDRVGDLMMYPLSNACGQLGQSYQDYHCSDEEKHMECSVDPEMTITAVTHAKW